MEKYVLIGGSTACYGAIKGIRSVDKDAEITVICGEKRPLYSRPLISYWLEGKTSDENLYFAGKDFYCKNKITALSYKVESLDAADKKVVLENGEKVPYGKLLVATGSYPFVPPMNGIDTVKKKGCFYTLEDAENLKKILKKDDRVLIIGAGLIGLKCAEGIYPTTRNITIVDMQNRVMPNVTTPAVGEIIEKHLLSKGITLELETSAAEFKGQTAVLKNGKSVDFDILILAIGVRPNVSLVKDAGGEVNRGIVVDGHMRTSLPDVYAAGDCAEGTEAVSGTKKLLQLFPSAYNGGLAAGKNMAGKEAVFDTDVALNSTKLLGLRIISCGSYEGEATEDTSDGYKALFMSDNKLNGYILVDKVDRAGIYTSLIAKRTDLSNFDKELLIRSPQLLAFDKNVRKSMLGGEV
jgi:NAD(P)H-nitrite reductase large subunit